MSNPVAEIMNRGQIYQNQHTGWFVACDPDQTHFLTEYGGVVPDERFAGRWRTGEEALSFLVQWRKAITGEVPDEVDQALKRLTTEIYVPVAMDYLRTLGEWSDDPDREQLRKLVGWSEVAAGVLLERFGVRSSGAGQEG